MGEIADEVLSGFRCERCACVMDDHDEPGHPRICQECEDDPYAAGDYDDSVMPECGYEWSQA